MAVIPIATAFTNGDMVQINDSQLAIVAACINALSALTDSHTISTGRVDMGDLEMANIARVEPLSNG